jgi:hypothetical protein
MAVTMKNAIFLGVMPCGFCKNQRFGGMYCLHHQDDKKWQARNVSSMALLHSVLQLLVTVSVITSLPILVTLFMEAVCSSEISVLTRGTQCNIPNDILQGQGSLISCSSF